MKTSNSFFKHPVFLLGIVSLLIALLIKPWETEYYNSLISWDKLGYYLYLPVAFIYKDWHTLSFVPNYLNVYQPSSYWFESLTLENGNQAFSYPIGIAIAQFPFFVLGYLSALLFNYELNGFSAPFVFWIYISGVVFSNLGVYYSYKSLNYFFDKKLSGIALLLLFAGTNLFYYCFIDNIMPHSYLFGMYSILIYNTIRWHQTPSFIRLLKICICIGLMVCMRATEVIAVLIPLLWGVYDLSSLKAKLGVVRAYLPQLILCVALGSLPFILQMVYWKYATGHFIFNPYAYMNLGFSWKSPHLEDFLVSFRKGFFTYAPLMVLSFLGLGLIFTKSAYKDFRLAFSLFILLNIYILSSWDVWWYGGSFGQRSMLQSYAVLVFLLAAWLEWIRGYKVVQLLSIAFILFCVIVNVSFTWQYKNEIMYSDGITKGMFKEHLLNPYSGYIPAEAKNEVGAWKQGAIRQEDLICKLDLNKDAAAVKDSSGASFFMGPDTFKEVVTLNTDSLIKAPKRWIRCSFEMKHPNSNPYRLNNLTIVAEVKGDKDDIRSWKSKAFNSLFKEEKDFNVWKKCEADFEVPKTFRTCDKMHFYFWMPGNENAWIRNIKMSSLELKTM